MSDNSTKASLFPLFDNNPNMYVKQTVTSLFKTLLETVMDVRSQSVIIMKTTLIDDIDSVLTRLSYSNSKIFTLNNDNKYDNFNVLNESQDVFEEDFLLIFSERFSVILTWDKTDTNGFLYACASLNSSIINGIFEVMQINADYKEVAKEVGKFNLDRRGNIMFDTILNKLLLKVEDYQRDLICAKNEMDDYNILEEKDVRNILRTFSHELRNQISMLGIYGKILSGHIEKIKTQAPTQETLETIEKSTDVIVGAIEHVENTLSEMSNYSQDFTLNLQEEDISKLVDNTISFAMPSFKEKGVNLILENQCSELYINIDKHKIYQVLLNLLKNALEVTPAGKNVWVYLYKIDDEIIIAVKDEGTGITKEILPKIFRAYFSTKESGTGIGLTLSKKIIEKHNGELTLVSNSDEGCEFQINLR